MTSRASRPFATLFASVLLAGALSACGADDVSDEGVKGKDTPTENPTTGGVKQ